MKKQSSHPTIKGTLAWLIVMSLINIGSTIILPISALAGEQQESAQQQKPEKPKESKGEATAEDIEREIQEALQLLYQAYSLAKDLPDPIPRIDSYIEIALALKDENRPFAREILRSAFEETKTKPQSEASKSGPSTKAQRTLEDLRREVLAHLDSFDPELASELKASVEQNKKTEPESSPRRVGKDTPATKRAAELMTLAHGNLDNDLKKAAEYAAASLREEVSYSFVRFIYQVREKDRRLADQLYNQALAAVFRNNPPLIIEIINLQVYVFGGWSFRMNYEDTNILPPDPAQAVQYLRVLLDILAKQGGAIGNSFERYPTSSRGEPDNSVLGFYRNLLMLRHRVMQYVPDRLQEIDSLLARVAQKVPIQGRVLIELVESRDTKSPEEAISDFLQKAGKAKNSEEQDRYLCAAITTAMVGKRPDDALEIVPKISDLDLRAEAADWVNKERINMALEKKDFESARRIARELTDPSFISATHIEIADKLIEQKDETAALATLVEAEAKLNRLPTSGEKIRALLHLVVKLIRLDRDRGFAAMSSAVTAMNRWEPSTTTHRKKTYFTIDSLLEELGEREDYKGHFEQSEIRAWSAFTMATLVKADPVRAQTLALAIKNPNYRIMAQIGVARGLLESAKEKKAKLEKDKPQQKSQ
jgi:hypothetical protein